MLSIYSLLYWAWVFKPLTARLTASPTRKPIKSKQMWRRKLNSWKKALETSIARFGKAPSIVVHNAASYPNKSGIDVTIEEFSRLFDVNVKSVYLASKILIPEMKKNGPGSTIVISNEDAIRPGPAQTWYNATNAGVSAAGQQPSPWPSNFPGTDFASKQSVPHQRIRHYSIKATPIGRLVESSDVANVALFLAEPASSILAV
ncbi:hypothetical protein AAE478_008054 [Parahypoxylon ruwenzoriense]